MFGSVVLNVVIGLVFIYLLYSLLATVISELIATQLGLRARNLKEAIDRMLNDERESGWWRRLWDSLKLLKSPSNPVVDKFYKQPEIKYLGSSGTFRLPSSFKAGSFSKALMGMLFGDGELRKEDISAKLGEFVRDAGGSERQLDPETAGYIQSLWTDANKDITKFRLLLEGWFDRTMEHTIEWYRRKIRIVTFILGFCLAWLFCADTIQIVKKLSVDKEASDQLVAMASSFMQQHDTAWLKGVQAAAKIPDYNRKMDTLRLIKSKIDDQIADANSILGPGGWLPDSVTVIVNPKTGETVYMPSVDPYICKGKIPDKHGRIGFSAREKWCYFLGLPIRHFWGILLTALAISLGAPFWFDLLSKIMSLRASVKVPAGSSTPANSATDTTLSPLNREA